MKRVKNVRLRMLVFFILLPGIKYCTHEYLKPLFLLYDLLRRQKPKIREMVDRKRIQCVIKNFMQEADILTPFTGLYIDKEVKKNVRQI